MSTNFHMMFLGGRPTFAPHADEFCSVRVHAGFAPEIFGRASPGVCLAVEYEEGSDVGFVYVVTAADADVGVAFVVEAADADAVFGMGVETRLLCAALSAVFGGAIF